MADVPAALGVAALGVTDGIVAAKDPKEAAKMVKTQMKFGLIILLIFLGVAVIGAAIVGGVASSNR